MDKINELLVRVQAIEGHHIFQLKHERNPKGTWHEGYILAVNNDHIIFSWAPSPFMLLETVWQKEHAIPLSWIEKASLYKNFETDSQN